MPSSKGWTPADERNYLDNAPNEILIIEELCRVMASAKRFQTCTEAWYAMMNVRRIAKSIRDEGRASMMGNIEKLMKETP